jgi:hypothetical protein
VKIQFDGLIMNIQPDALNWEPPSLISRDGDYAPVRGQYFSCRLALGKMVVPSLQDWQTVFTTTSHTAILPHPYTGVMTSYAVYVDSVTPRMDVSDTLSDCAVIAGLDVMLSGILVV